MHPRIVILLLAPEESPPRRSCPMAAKWAAQGVETNSKTGPESRPGAIGAASLRRRDGSGAPRAPPVKGWRIGRPTGQISVIARATETDRKSVRSGKRVSGRGDLGGGRYIK